jgi:hypothetical protein
LVPEISYFFVWFFVLLCSVVTYTHILHAIDHGQLRGWNTVPAPQIAKKYWKLKDGSSMRDVILHIRADEAHHRGQKERQEKKESGEIRRWDETCADQMGGLIASCGFSMFLCL